MSRSFRHLTLSLTVSAAVLALGMSGTQAQSRGRFSGYTEAAPVPHQNENNLQTFFTFGDFRAVVITPVQGPGNSNVAYHTFEGQSMTGGDAVVAQMGRTPLLD